MRASKIIPAAVTILIAAALLVLSATGAPGPAGGRDRLPRPVEADVPVPAIDTATPPVLTLDQVADVDLQIVSFTAPSGVNQGESFPVEVEVRNAGTEDFFENFSVHIFISDDDDFTTGYTMLAAISGPEGLPAGANHVILGEATAGINAPTGDVYIGAYVDWSRHIAETDESNNSLSRPIAITAIPSTSIYAEDFQDGPAGWEPVDLTVTTEHHFSRVLYPVNIIPHGVWWCGDDNPYWAAPPGYGNNWDETLSKAFSLTTAPYQATFSIQYDTEPAYDYVWVQVSNDGGNSWSVLANYDGSSGGFTELSADLSAYAGQTVLLGFRFTSDGGVSDEDGLYGWDSNGAFRLDWVEVSGHPRDDFETGDDGWTPTLPEPCGYSFRLEEEPACTSYPADYYSGSGAPIISCNAWVAYDPNTLSFPEVDADDRAAVGDVTIGIDSPAIPIPPDATTLMLVYDRYCDLSLENGVFYRTAIAAPADSPFQNVGSWFYSLSGWSRGVVDITAAIRPGATDMKIRLIASDIGYLYGYDPDTHSPGPFFDNVRIVAYNTADPGVDVSSWPRPCGWSAGDADGDGVLDADDLCPGENASYFDRNDDGCLDDVRGARHVEYWSYDDFPVGYRIHQGGAPLVTDGSDIAAVQAGFDAWTTIGGAEIAFSYEGTTTQADAQALDFVNLVTWSDPDYVFPSGVVAVGLSTSFTTPIWDGDGFRPGQVADCDMIFNPAMKFQTPTMGSGLDVQSIVTHEVGHMLGLSHSAVPTSTMFYVLQPATGAASLELEDELAMLKAYPSAATLAGTGHLRGTVTSGTNGVPVPGVAVFAIEAGSGDTLCCDYTLPGDGSYHFIGLPDGDYYVAIHGLDGTSQVSYLTPAHINFLVQDHAVTTVVPEYWDAAESAGDDPAAMTPIAVAAGLTATADLVTNIDTTGPTILAVSPGVDDLDVAVDAAVLVRFDEAIDGGSLAGNFVLETAAGGGLLPGNAALVEDGRTLAYVPASNLDFGTEYVVIVRGGVSDEYGNIMGTPYSYGFSTQAQPAVAISDLAPRKGEAGSVVVITGEGLAADPLRNVAYFGGQPVPVLKGSSTELVIQIPEGIPPSTAAITITNLDKSQTSNGLQFSVLEPQEVARAHESDGVDLGALPRSVVAPDTIHVLVATDAGLSIVDVTDPSGPTHVAVPSAGGLNDLAVIHGGRTVLGVSAAARSLCRFRVDPPQLLDEMPLGVTPRGIVANLAGDRAYVATDAGEIRIYDTKEYSATFGAQLGTITSPDPNLLGPLAIDPAGDELLALTGNGRLLFFDLASGALFESAPVQPSPAAVVIDAAGELAYVSDRTGYVTVVSMAAREKILDVRTGGELAGLALAPSGSFVYAADRQLDFLDVIDLREGAPTYRTIADRLAQRPGPVDVAFAPDGSYAYSLAADEQKLVIAAAGSGPILTSVGPRAGPVGTQVVLAGVGFTGAGVSFGGIPAQIQRATDTELAVTVPAGATSGPLTVLGTGASEVSNSIRFEVLPPGDAGLLRLAGVAQPSVAAELTGAFAISPLGDVAVAGDQVGQVWLLDIDPRSPGFQSFHGGMGLPGAAIGDLAFSPDGKLVYAVGPAITLLSVVNSDPGSAGFGGLVNFIGLGGLSPARIAVAPGGGRLLVSDPGIAGVHVVDPTSGAVATFGLAEAVPGLDGRVGAVAWHPGGSYAYLAALDDDPATVLVLDLSDPGGGGYGTVVGSVALPAGAPAAVPISLDFSPDGSRCWVLTSQQTDPATRTVLALDTGNPTAPVLLESPRLGVAAGAAMEERLVVSPAGDRALLNLRDEGLFQLDLADLTTVEQIDLAAAAGPLGLVYDPDGSRVLLAGSVTDEIRLYDFNAQQQIVKVWGDGQTGVVGRPLASPLRVRVTDLATGEGSPGVPVTFSVAAGGGQLATAAGAAGTSLSVGTDAYGYAEVLWTLGPLTGAQSVTAEAVGAIGSPLAYQAEAIADPLTLPLEYVESLLYPADGAVGVGITTAVQVTFTRPVDRTYVVPATFSLSADGGVTAVPTVLGFADGDRKLSLTPREPLAYGATYTIVLGAGLRDTGGGTLQNWGSTTFTTASPPPAPTLTTITPPGAAVTVGVMLTGGGFAPDPALNEVWFGDVQATVTDAAPDYLIARVPVTAVSGDVHVVSGGQTTGAVPFTVLVPVEASGDEVLATVGTGSATRTVTISPDGTIIYAVSPEADLIVPIVMETLRTMPGIPVGDEPWAIDLHPDGTFAYTANRLSGDVSIVDIDPDSPTWHEVVGYLEVGRLPVDVAVTPAGDRVLVANAGSENLSVIDCDDQSAAFHSVIATVGTGSSARTVTISPDGGRIYLGTDTGYLVLGTIDYGILSRVDTGTAAKTVTISPDGALLVLIDTQGTVLVFDVAPGSATEDQVVATLPGGTAAKSATISPDGALLFLIMEEGNTVQVYSLDVGKSAWVIVPDGLAQPVELRLIQVLDVGENPQFVACDPSGTGRIVVTNAGESSVTVIGPASEGTVSGRVYADCGGAVSGLYGIEVDVFANGTGELVTSLMTDEQGTYEVTLPAGDYTLTLVTPLGYTIDSEEEPVTIGGGEPAVVDWALACELREPSQRKMSFWKHQVGVALRGHGQYDIDGPTLCGYLDLIEDHFNSNALNPVVVYEPPDSDLCPDKLEVTRELLNLDGDLDMLAHARQELMALLFNVAGGYLSLRTVVTLDGIPASKVITYVDHLIDDGDPANDEEAMKAAKWVNMGKKLNIGAVPPDLPDISYLAPKRFYLAPSFPNPFNPAATIGFDIAAPGRVRLRIYDVKGRLVRTLVDETRQPGSYTVIWSGRDDGGRAVSSGVYFYRLEAGGYLKTRKMMLVK